MKKLLAFTSAFIVAICAHAAQPSDADGSRKRLLMDDDWRFQIEPQVVIPSGKNTLPVTDWLIKESPNGEADAQEISRLATDTKEWAPAKTGVNITQTHKGKFVWYRAELDPLLAGTPLTGPISVFFAGAGPRAVVYFNGHKVTELSGTVRSLNASELLQTGIVSEGGTLDARNSDIDYFQACLDPWWNKDGKNVLTVMIRVGTGGFGGITDKVVLFSGFAPESQPGFDDSSWRKVGLPHDYVVEGTFDKKYNNQRGALPVPRAWYRKKFIIPADDVNRSIWIDFDGIYRDSQVWVNGHYLGNHPSGYTSFRYDISRVANVGGENTVAVLVDPRVAEGWWYEGGGIYRHVWLNTADKLHVAPWGTFITSEVKDVLSDRPGAELTIKTRVTNDSIEQQSFELLTTVTDPDGKPVAGVSKTAQIEAGQELELTQTASLESVRLWSCESPNMYLATTKVLRGQAVVDTYTTPFGIRTIRFDADRGFFLNEKPVRIYGTCNHLDFAGVGIAMPDNLQAWRITKLQQMGANAWRSSHNPPSPEFLDACDRMGVLVIDENRHLGDTYDRKTSGLGYVANDLGDLRDMILRDRNHPSIILWSLCNEEKHTPENTRLFQAMKARAAQYDTTRPFTGAVIGSEGDSIEGDCDVIGLNYAVGGRYDNIRKKFPGKPIYGSENGSARADRSVYFNYPISSTDWKTNPPIYMNNYTTRDLMKGSSDNVNYWVPVAEREWVAGAFYWTGFDYRGEPSPSPWPAVVSHFGIMDLCGFPKDYYYYYKAWWGAAKPLVHIMPHWNWPGKEGEIMRVVVLSNCEQIDLLLNGQSLGSKPIVPHNTVEWQVPYAPGRLEARGSIGQKLVATGVVETVGSPAALQLRTDMGHLQANKQDIAVMEVTVVDAQGRKVPTASDLVSFSLSGPGTIAGVGNGDPASHEPDAAARRKAFNGHCACLIRAGDKAGVLTLTATAPGLSSATLEVRIEETNQTDDHQTGWNLVTEGDASLPGKVPDLLDGINNYTNAELPVEVSQGIIVAEEKGWITDHGELTFDGVDRIAYDDTGVSFLTKGDKVDARQCPVERISADKVPVDASERAMMSGLGGTVELTFPGVDANTAYDLELSFLSDNDERVQKITAGKTVLEERLALPKAQILVRHWPVPASACADGTLVITIYKMSRDNTVLSRATLRAQNADAKPFNNAKMRQTMTIPRISPRPLAVSGVKTPRFDLGGTWRFNPVMPEGFGRGPVLSAGDGWADIQVPGQWAQQGFTVDVNKAAAYIRTFTVPADWKGQRIKLRCDAVYSDTTIWIAGKEIGKHLGGFTPFEFDVTDAITPGKETTIELAVQSSSQADKLASGMKYAAHDLGGIPRKIYLMALPPVNIASLHVRTTFDNEFKNAELAVNMIIANDSANPSSPASVTLELRDPMEKKAGTANVAVPAIKPGEKISLNAVMKIDKPMKWDVERPNLYTLETSMGFGKVAETVSTRLGFRQVEVRGNQVFVNGHVVKLRGVCRHEVHPTRGRSLEGDLWRGDAELFARANVNFVRTSHYPPAEEFLDACDEIGLLVACEAPFCWTPFNVASDIVLRQTLEMVEFNRNHTSVVIWSTANESPWSPAFKLSANAIRKLDPSRLILFGTGRFMLQDHDKVDMASLHYPGCHAPGRQLQQPLIFDEYCHLNSYNRREQLADSGLRDVWGLGFSKMWETMRAHPGCLGGAIWAAIDDTFFLPGDRTAGYGTWGPLDGWRRPKPEYWHLTKVYSPVRILDEKVDMPAVGEPISLTLENRSDFANLNEMRFDWKLGRKSGESKVEAAPGQKGALVIPVGKDDLSGEELEIRIAGPRGFEVDAYRFVINEKPVTVPAALRKPGALELAQDAKDITVSGIDFKYSIDAVTGQFKACKGAGNELPISGPCLTLIPLDKGVGAQMAGKEPTFTPLWGLCTDWKPSSVAAAKTDRAVTVKVTGSYCEAEGGYELLIDNTGRITVSWNFSSHKEVNPRQTGMTFILPKSCSTLSWHRRGQWSVYPEDHIGRLSGRTKAFYEHPVCGLAGPRTLPTWSWNEDQNQYGCNDFRSTKFNILEATLSDDCGRGLRAVAAADRHVHTWIDGDHAGLLIADYANEGAEDFFKNTRAIPDKKIEKGGMIAGSVQLDVTK